MGWQTGTFVGVPGEDKLLGISVGARVTKQQNRYKCYARAAYLPSASDEIDDADSLELAKQKSVELMKKRALALYHFVQANLKAD